jgi:hypothetical protein
LRAEFQPDRSPWRVHSGPAGAACRIGARFGVTLRQVERQFARAIYKVHRHMAGERLRRWDGWI